MKRFLKAWAKSMVEFMAFIFMLAVLLGIAAVIVLPALLIGGWGYVVSAVLIFLGLTAATALDDV